jgi:hypothetical protein
MSQPAAPAAAPPAPAVSSSPALAPGQQDAFDALRGTLHLFGLDDPEMVAWVKQQIIDGTGQSSIMLALYDPATVPGKVVDRMYPEIRGRREANLAPISIQDAVGYRDNAIQLMHAAGLPPEFYDQPEDLARFQIRDVSLVELKSRIDEAAMASTQAPPETRAQLQSLYGVDSGHLTAYYLDPDKAQPVLQKQFAAATLSGTGVRSGYGALDRSQAERLATLGVSGDQAAQGSASWSSRGSCSARCPARPVSAPCLAMSSWRLRSAVTLRRRRRSVGRRRLARRCSARVAGSRPARRAWRASAQRRPHNRGSCRMLDSDMSAG